MIAAKAYVIGDPVAHSLSPLLHQTWLDEVGIAGSYQAILAKPDAVTDIVRELFADPNTMGINVTLPHKQRALAFADEVTPLARRTGAANFLYRKNGRIIADNTDIEGFLQPLLKTIERKELSGLCALVFGAGGAARAVLAALLAAKTSQILLCNRSDDKAEALCAELGVAQLKTIRWAQRNQPGPAPDLVINASSAGMTGYDALDVDLAFCGPNTVIYDLVYSPLVTPLLVRAAASNLKHIGGLEMLISQARPCFELFFGVQAPTSSRVHEVLSKALLAKQRAQ
ncbi:MAG: shikimate dehydrogenase [Robiginitomaculum sp.]|nr:shikimate dehydrogenase [Robiginitomaculum sp.]